MVTYRSLVPRPLSFGWISYRTAAAWALILLGLLIGGVTETHAQKTTERFIPIGQSPGLSGRVTLMGTVRAVDRSNQVLTVADTSDSHAVAFTERTHIWLDRSALKQPNLRGTPDDLQEGLRVEVKFEDNDRDAPAEWIKVAITDAEDGG